MGEAAAIIYAGKDPRDAAAYPFKEAARFLHLPNATLRSWTVGRHYPTREGKRFFEPLISPIDPVNRILSFWNLIEAHVLRAFRRQHGVTIPAIRNSIQYAELQLGIERLLLSKQLSTSAGEVLLDHLGRLISLSRSGQLVMKHVLEAHLKRVEWDENMFPVKLYPFVTDEVADEAPRLILINPYVAFGRPVVASRTISTAAIASRIDAGESVEDLVDDYGIEPKEVQQALLYEAA